MITQDFDRVIAHRIETIRRVLTAKAEEYARGDRLSNFKRAAAMQNITPEKALVGMKAKHDVALMDFINDLDSGKIQTYDRWDEKIGDIINYLILLDGLIQERIRQIEGRPLLLPVELTTQEKITKELDMDYVQIRVTHGTAEGKETPNA